MINFAASFVHLNTFSPLMGLFMLESFVRNNIEGDKCYDYTSVQLIGCEFCPYYSDGWGLDDYNGRLRYSDDWCSAIIEFSSHNLILYES